MKKPDKINLITFIDVPFTAISQDARNLLDTYLLCYMDNSVLGEHLYFLEEHPNLISQHQPGYADLIDLHNLCVAHRAAYIRLIKE